MVHQLFRKKYVTAVFAANDAVVFGVLKAAVESKSFHTTIRTLIALRNPIYRGYNVGECPKVYVV
jgi:hypothetical protein